MKEIITWAAITIVLIGLLYFVSYRAETIRNGRIEQWRRHYSPIETHNLLRIKESLLKDAGSISTAEQVSAINIILNHRRRERLRA